MLEHPQVACIDCDHCSKVAYDLKTGKPILHAGDFIPVRQPPCATDSEVCPKGKPGQKDLTPENQEIWQHWLWCDSVDEWPDETEVRRYRKIIDRIRDSVKARHAQRDQMLLLRSLSIRKR